MHRASGSEMTPGRRTPYLVITLVALAILGSGISRATVVCKCTGTHCAEDVCEGDYCSASLIEASPHARIRWPDEPTQLYVRGCAYLDVAPFAADLIDGCFEYDESENEHDRRKVCVCSSRMCNDGPLVNASLNHFRQRTCPNGIDGDDCRGEFCLDHRHRPSTVEAGALHCINRTLPLFDQLLLGVIVSPALAPTILPFPGQLDPSVSVIRRSSSYGRVHPDSSTADDHPSECPTMFLRTEHRDDPETCIPPKYGLCRGRFCLDVRFNSTTFRGTVLERRYRGCVVGFVDEEAEARLATMAANSGGCAVFESPSINVTACVSATSDRTIPGIVLMFAFGLTRFVTRCF